MVELIAKTNLGRIATWLPGYRKEKNKILWRPSFRAITSDSKLPTCRSATNLTQSTVLRRECIGYQPAGLRKIRHNEIGRGEADTVYENCYRTIFGSLVDD